MVEGQHGSENFSADVFFVVWGGRRVTHQKGNAAKNFSEVFRK